MIIYIYFFPALTFLSLQFVCLLVCLQAKIVNDSLICGNVLNYLQHIHQRLSLRQLQEAECGVGKNVTLVESCDSEPLLQNSEKSEAALATFKGPKGS